MTPVECARRAVRGSFRIRTAALGRPGRRSCGGGDQPRRTAARHPRLRRPGGTGVRRPSRGGRPPYAVGPAAGRPGVGLAGPAADKAGPAGVPPPPLPCRAAKPPESRPPRLTKVSPGPAEQYPGFIAVRRFAGKEVVPVIGPCWERAEIPWQLAGQLPQPGITGEDISGYRVFARTVVRS